MGIINSRRNSGAPEVDNSSGSAYRYPPKTGYYFASHFIMGGERFESTKQDVYLFGENEDLNFLSSKPFPFPYPAPQPREPTRTLKCLVNIRKDSLRFVKDLEENHRWKNEGELSEQRKTCYNIEFTFDTDVKCAITIYYFATEEILNKQAIYHPRDATMNSETFHYKRGVNQVFCQPTHVINPSHFKEEDLQYRVDKETIPVVIQCVVEDEGFVDHSHVTFASVEKSSDGGYVLKPLKQKQMVDGLFYLMQEIYGIENKNVERAKMDDEFEDSGSECVICMCETRDTLILPCRHLCLCNCCADNLRYQASNCPICRVKFCALLQIRAIRRKIPPCPLGLGILPQVDAFEVANLSQDGVPAGYEAVSLIEALNGPPTLAHSTARNLANLPTDSTLQSLYAAVVGGVVISTSLATTPDGSAVSGDDGKRESMLSDQDTGADDGERGGAEEETSEDSSSSSSATLSPAVSGRHRPPLPEIKLSWVTDHPLAPPLRKSIAVSGEEEEEEVVDRMSVHPSSICSSVEILSEYSSSRESLAMKDVEEQPCTVLSYYDDQTDTDVTPIHVGRRTLAAAAAQVVTSNAPTCMTSDPLHAVVWLNLEASAAASEAPPTTSSSTKNLLEYDADDGIKEKDL